MSPSCRNTASQSGMTLILTMLLMLSLTMMASAIIVVVNNHADLTSSVTQKPIAMKSADTCIDQAIVWLLTPTGATWSATGVGTIRDIAASGETLYGISRLYDISVGDIKTWNKLVSNDLSLGQKLLVKSNKKVLKIIDPTDIKRNNESEDKTIFHIVEPGETLYGISKLYNVDVDEIVNWNQLNSTSLSLGQKLTIHNSDHEPETEEEISKSKVTVHVVEPGDTFYGISKRYEVSVEKLLELNNKDNFNLEIGEKLIVSEE